MSNVNIEGTGAIKAFESGAGTSNITESAWVTLAGNTWAKPASTGKSDDAQRPAPPPGELSDRSKDLQQQPLNDLEKAFKSIFDNLLHNQPKNDISEGEAAAGKQLKTAAALIEAGKFEDLIKIADQLRKVGENGEGLGFFQKMLSEKMNARISFGKDSITIGEPRKGGDAESKSITLTFEKDEKGVVTAKATESTSGGPANPPPESLPLADAQEKIKKILKGEALK